MDNKREVEEYNRNSLKAGVWCVIAEILVRGVSFFSTPIYTRILPKAVFGNVKVFESWIYLLIPVISLSLYSSIERAKLDFKKQYDAYISSIVTLHLILFMVVGAVSFIWKNNVKELFSFSECMIWIALVYGFFYACILCFQKRERQFFYYKSNVAVSFFSVVPPIAISTWLLLRYKDVASEEQLTDLRIIGFYLPIIILGVIIVGILYYRGKMFVNLEYWKYGIRYSVPLIVYTVSTQILYQSDKIMIQRLRGEDLAAIYSLAATIVYIIDILSNAIQGSWVPWLFEKLNVRSYKEVHRIWVILTLGMGMLSWGIVMIAPELVYFMGGKGYEEARWLMGSMLSAAVFQFIMLSFVSVEKFYKKTVYSGQAGMLVALLNIALNYICIKRFGYQAAAYTTAISYFAAILLHYFYAKKYVEKGVVPIRKLLMICVGLWGMNMVSMLSYPLPLWQRFGILLMAVGVIFAVAGKQIRMILQLGLKS